MIRISKFVHPFGLELVKTSSSMICCFSDANAGRFTVKHWLEKKCENYLLEELLENKRNKDISVCTVLQSFYTFSIQM